MSETVKLPEKIPFITTTDLPTLIRDFPPLTKPVPPAPAITPTEPVAPPAEPKPDTTPVVKPKAL